MQGRVHGGRHVRTARAPHSRHSRGLRNGRREGHEEGFGPERLHDHALEIDSVLNEMSFQFIDISNLELILLDMRIHPFFENSKKI